MESENIQFVIIAMRKQHKENQKMADRICDYNISEWKLSYNNSLVGAGHLSKLINVI